MKQRDAVMLPAGVQAALSRNKRKNRIKGNKAETAYKLVCIICATAFGLLCLYPLLYAVGLSLVTRQEWLDTNGLIALFPKTITFAAYGNVLRDNSYILKSLGISVLRTVLGTVGGVLVAAILGYVLSRKRLPGKNIITWLVIFSIFFGGGMIPNYIVVKDLRLDNTIWALVLPGLLNTWYALIFKQFFAAIPEELEEAAKIDGVNEFQLFYKIILPMSLPIFASIGLFTMVNCWNSWFDAMLYIDSLHSSLWPLQYYVTLTFGNLSQIDSGIAGNWQEIVGTNNDVPLIATQMALTIISLLPIIIIYPLFQKYFTKGVYMGAIK